MCPSFASRFWTLTWAKERYALFHAYTWDPNWGNALSVDTVNLTYDAMGRMVEQNRSGSYTQILFGPNGEKLALMFGQILSKAFVPLPAGAQAVYTSAGLTYYRHPDWLGSSRFASTPTRTMYTDQAFPPFGENYVATGGKDLDFTGQIASITDGLYDFWFREYHPKQGRWISPDPAGLSAADPSNPQSWNRYAYVGNNPLNTVDPDGLCGLLDTSSCGLSRPNEDPGLTDLDVQLIGTIGWSPGGRGIQVGEGPWDSANLGLGLDIAIVLGGGEAGGGRVGAHVPSTPPSSTGHGNIGNFPNGESLGIPAGMSLHPGNLSSVLFPGSDPGCDFGVCGQVNGFGPGLVLAGGVGEAICVIAEPCGAGELIFGGLFVGTVVAIDAGRAYLSNISENRTFNKHIVPSIEQRCGRKLTPNEKQRLHREVSKQGYSPDEIIELGVGMFCPGR